MSSKNAPLLQVIYVALLFYILVQIYLSGVFIATDKKSMSDLENNEQYDSTKVYSQARLIYMKMSRDNADKPRDPEDTPERRNSPDLKSMHSKRYTRGSKFALNKLNTKHITASHTEKVIKKFNEPQDFKSHVQQTEISLPLVGRSKPISIETFPKELTFKYDAFKMAEPNCVDEEDLNKFRKHPLNVELMQQSAEKLRGVLRIIDNGVFNKSISRSKCGWKSPFDEIKSENLSPTAAVHVDILCPLMVPGGSSFQHFLDGILPKIVQALDLLLNKGVKILIPLSRDVIILEILEALGIGKDKILFHAGRIYAARKIIYTCITPPLHPTLWQNAHKLMNAPDKLPVPREEAYVILLTRKQSHNGGRKMLNQIKVQAFLEKRYGKDRVIVYPGRYNLTTSVSVFGRARLMIGVHGGALYNLNFASSDVSVVEILPSDGEGNPIPSGIAHSIFWSMCNMLNQSYWRIYNKAETRNGNLIVDLGKLDRVLDRIDQRL
ncbi:uncharacterized protein LOC106159645 [Lingula anatina]|uniref:Uncharacterized protein LOC106159645 n=1 Tax=Lingula anatina TaxID=7574 RepID=A0A1S3HZI1_LINAN|nr:uncharacterized protein LOC106159645 [Lingula anatina]XP_013391423.1 uncharacterized protein LOC106159645 [Lingula anatina]XP_013391424.1 uncharacterized protein LOC106159645 [Lingula anatina]|eukprot:XP_013391422.1 uncharacterized protein LOC106159645 [Lingula anatina]